MSIRSAAFAIGCLFLVVSAQMSPAVYVCHSLTTVPMQASQCNTGNLQCCNTVQPANSPSLSPIWGLLGISVVPVDSLVGLGCSPITIIGAGSGANCAQQPVCCEYNQFNGLISLCCTPVSL